MMPSETDVENLKMSASLRPIVPSRRAVLALAAATAALQTMQPRATRAEPPGVLLAGGPIHTGVADAAPVEAVAILGNRIAFVGALAEARRAVPGAREIDLAGAAAFPGFVDSHVHLVGVGMREMTLNLEGSASIAELQARLGAWAARQPTGPILGSGWIETHWPEHRFPTHADLDAVVADRPVYLERSDGHAGVANSAALALAGITASTPNPAGGEILRDASGAPAGMFVDNAQRLIRDRLPKPDAARTREALARADRLYRSRGWTAGHHMAVDQMALDALRGLSADGKLGIRVDNYMIWESASEVLARGPFADPTGKVRVRGIKMFADGALGSRGAALLAPYSDKPESTGLLVTPHEVMVDRMIQAKAAGAQVAVHAIGDRGNRLTLDAMAKALGEAHTDRRWRIEHAQILSPQDLPRFAAMGVMASMQPSHAIGDLYFAKDRLGVERLKGGYAWRALLESGAVVCAGTDAPVEKGDPLVEFYAATYRHALNGFAGPDWGLDQAVSRNQALHMITAAPAYAVGRESELGTLEVGKRADISVFSKDLMRVEPAEIPSAKAVLTMVDGQVVHGD
jgi:predicted amidohydrolase YtcJ